VFYIEGWRAHNGNLRVPGWCCVKQPWILAAVLAACGLRSAVWRGWPPTAAAGASSDNGGSPSRLAARKSG
jgi:hypothetical protein